MLHDFMVMPFLHPFQSRKADRLSFKPKRSRHPSAMNTLIRLPPNAILPYPLGQDAAR